MTSLNLADEISRQAAASPEAIAIQHPEGMMTFRELEDAVWRAATFLSMNQVKRGDVVALTVANDVTALIAMLALARIGATAFSLPLHSPVLLRKEMAESVRAMVLVTDLPEADDAGVPRLLIDAKTIVTPSTPIDFSLRDPQPRAPWLIIIGSGSTGKPKIFPFSHTQFLARMIRNNSSIHLSPRDRVGSLLSLDTLVTKDRFIDALCAGASLVMPGSKMLKAYGWISDYHVSVLWAAVVNAEKLLDGDSRGMPNPVGSLRMLALGCSTVSDSLRIRITERLTPNLYIFYGIAELGVATLAGPADIASTPGTVGRPPAGVKVEVVDADGNALSTGETGFVRAHSPGAVGFYLDNVDASERAFKDGWFYPGDLGKFTEDGQLIFCGRVDHMMIMNGINIYPAEIEAVMTRHPAVRDAAAIPLHHPVHQDIPVCAVTLHRETEASAQALQDFAHQHLGIRGPKKIVVLDEIPRNHMGKLIRKQLMQEITTRLSLSSTDDVDMLSAAGSNDVPARACRQPMRLMTLRLACTAHTDLQRIDFWLQSVLGVELSPCEFQMPQQAHEAAAAGGMAWRCLLLIRALLQAGNIPAFDTGSVQRIIPDKENHLQWTVVVTVASIEHIPTDYYALATDAAVKIIHWVLERPVTPQHIGELYTIMERQVLEPLKKMEIPGKSRIPVLRVAHQMNIPFSHLGAGIYQLGWGYKARRMDRSTTPLDSAMGSRLAQNKFLSANLLRMAGLPAPVQGAATTQQEALRVARQIGWPVVVKPADLDRGEGVTIGIKSNESLTAAFNAAIRLSKDKLVVIEREVPGICHRIFIAAGQMLYAVKRLPKSVIGNGVQTVDELIREANASEQKRPPWLRSKPFPRDAEAVEALAAAGFNLDSVPAQGDLAPLRHIESTEWGSIGDTHPVDEVTEAVHPANLDIALRAADLFHLDVVGIDIISLDISRPWHENGAVINEVNFSPLLGGSVISKKYIPVFLRRYIQGDGRIPIDVMVGGKAAMDQARELHRERVSGGMKCFLTNHDLTLTASCEEMPFPFTGLYRRCRALLMNPQVESLVLVLQNDEWLHTGTPVDRVNDIITVDQDLIDMQRSNEPLAENKIHRLMAMLSAIKQADMK